MGSKARIAKYIAPFILDHLTTETVYIEPFAGGMNMVSHINTKHAGPVIAADSHEYLIQMWDALLSGWQPPGQISREQYYAIKNNQSEIPHLTGWVGFVCSYAGKWFNSYVGTGQVKSGRVRDYQSEAINNIQRQLSELDGVILQCCDYRVLDIPDGAVVYCDPPYVNTRQYRDKFNTAEFWNWVRELSNRCTVFVSEYTAPDDFNCIWSREVTSGISGTKTTSIESLFMLKSSLP
ncbi:DNA adenine methylase [Xenorhabdus khoisanae]|uniref:DNA adenine methylase n=1 Tax=Xenorhabdus khoisanae TaxID=880157 RepID=UPI00069DD1D7|nr:DNA adenine methylase [Xenorhabdus khoisanae]